MCGAACNDDPKHQNIPFLGGWLASGLLGFGDLRDLPPYLIKGDALEFGLTVAALVPAYGDAGSTIRKTVKYVAKKPGDIVIVGRVLIKALPTDSSRISGLDKIYTAIKFVNPKYENAVSTLRDTYKLPDSHILKYADESINIGDLRKGLDDLVVEHGAGKLSTKTAGKTGKFDEPVTDIRVAGAGVKGADIVATMKDGRKIGREVATLQPEKVKTVDDFTNALKGTIYEKSKQLKKTPEDIKELHVQINKGTDFANKDTLLDSIKRAKGDLKKKGHPYVFDKVVLYDGAGNILAAAG